ncbi:FadR/GntR family transcriptional regulator [Paeniglutamicibacter kerguelensis]|uniref:GntR family transcriptional repressor for pyruvate dehydrogenase complex n=1 Tax=Paeniglutamicibacter kerguelensis TaxID=254788 RepID=A0ABS4XJN9_9MICC|nr:FCD domain-containing protein [Paeniglutamicibacter kerguelensis]MBP2387894.1 GntR family transcriptional repressor for pyruvate dehydrogenase complex [Paeniglutamicibacter kerguelensis]
MKANLTTELVKHLREQISSGLIAPGDKLPSENALIAEHDVSRTVVREALTRLQAEGLVHTRRGAGSFALTPPAPETAAQARVPRTLAERRQLLEFRMGFESEAAAAAAGTANTETLRNLDAALAAFTKAGTNASLSMNCDFEFHAAVASASGNPYFLDAVQHFGPAMIAMPRQRLESQDSIPAPRLEQVAGEHLSIRNAIASGNAMAAAAAMRVHLANSLHRLEIEAGVASADD